MRAEGTSIRKKEDKKKKPPQSLSPVGEKFDRSRSHHFYEREGRIGLQVGENYREQARAQLILCRVYQSAVYEGSVVDQC